MDSDGYPTEEELQKIEKWSYHDFPGLMEYVKDLWRYSDCGYWHQEGFIYKISTGGWSGNETVIGALKQNHMFWVICWEQSRRGGHYIFRLPE